MSTKNYARPKWGQLYLALPLLAALFALDFRLDLSELGHQIVQIGILAAVYGFVHVWLQTNKKALSEMDRVRHGKISIRLQSPAQTAPDTHKEKRPLIRLPNSEISVLSDTFEMDCVHETSKT